MIRSFEELYAATKALTKRRMAVAAPQDLEVLESVVAAQNRGLVQMVLVGDAQRTREIAEEYDLDIEGMEIIDIPDNQEAAREAVRLVSTGYAHMLMKGILDTATLLRQVLDPEIGLRTGRLISHVAVMEIPELQRLLLMTDGGMVIAPNLEQKVEMLKNAFWVARGIGIEEPKAVPIAAFEQVNPKMVSSMDADALAKMNNAGDITGCIVEGPIALDVALSAEAAKHKKIESRIAGDVDLFLTPNIDAGNIHGKALVCCAGAKMAGIVLGAKAPIVLASRSDNAESKFNSIVLACAIAE